jgi:hypothetical protein
MQDDDVDGLLRKYRPAAPSRAFEESLLESLDRETWRSPQRRTWPWAVAAAALLAVTIGLHTIAFVAAQGSEEVLDPQRVQQLADEIGGPGARAMAEYIVREEQRSDAEAQQWRGAAPRLPGAPRQ